MTDVAKAAGSSKETLYSYFGDKRGLLREVLVALVPLKAPVLVESAGAAAPSSREAIAAHLEELARWLVAELMNPQYLALARIVIAESPRDPALGELFRAAIAERAFAAVVEAVRAGVAAGGLAPGFTESAIARGFVGPLLTYVLLDGLLASPKGIRPPQPAELKDIVSFFLAALKVN